MQTALNNNELKKKIKISEIFYSIQCEASSTGLPTTFIRLSGCPLRCSYCDTEHAFSDGNYLEIAEIIKKVSVINTKNVCVTGGEPLAQKNCLALLDELCNKKYTVSLETSGAFDIKDVNSKVIKVLDIKTPSSGESNKNLTTNINYLKPNDCLKVVICNRADYDWAINFINKNNKIPCEVYFSPSHNDLPSKKLANWILKDNAPVRLQLQIHKFIWGNERGR